MYQIFEITLKPKEVHLSGSAKIIKSMGWYMDDSVLVKEDGGLQYVLDLSAFTLKGLVSELFPIVEGKWAPEEFPAREEIVNSAITQLRKLPLALEISEIRRIVTHE